MNFISSHPAFNDTIDSLKNEFKNDKSELEKKLKVINKYSKI